MGSARKMPSNWKLSTTKHCHWSNTKSRTNENSMQGQGYNSKLGKGGGVGYPIYSILPGQLRYIVIIFVLLKIC